MRKNFFKRIFCLSLFPTFVLAQNPDSFKQLDPMIDNEYLEATHQAENVYIEANNALHLGITPGQLTALLNIVEINLGENYSTPLRDLLTQLTTKQ